MHFSRKSRPREFNTAGDRVQRIDDITTFLHLATNKCGLCRSTCATLSSDHASVIPTHDISWFRRSCCLSTSNTIWCVLHVSCHRDSERVAPRSDLFICVRNRRNRGSNRRTVWTHHAKTDVVRCFCRLDACIVRPSNWFCTFLNHCNECQVSK